MRSLAISLTFSVGFASMAMADCKADLEMQNQLAEMLNTMTKDGNCADTVSRSFIFDTFQQQHLEVVKRLRAECSSVGSNPITELQKWIDNNEEAEKACKQPKMFLSAVEAASQTAMPMRPLELALVMDTTGSMNTFDKIAGAKAAARQLLDEIYGGNLANVPESEYVRVALVPFAAAVRLNENAYDFNLDWIDSKGLNPLSKLNFNDPAWNNYMAWGKLKSSESMNMRWNGCVEARAKGKEAEGTDYALNDADPVAERPDTLFPAYFAPDTPSIGDVAGYADEYRRRHFTGTYIPEDSEEPNEITGLKKRQAQDFSDAGLELRQKNQAKYNGRIISAESATASAGPWSGCAKSPIVPLTYNRANIEAGITAMSAAGNTLIAEGIAWGVRVLSPSEPFAKVEGTSSIAAETISSFNHPQWRKVMVLMSDGDNDLSAGVDSLNGTVYSAYGRGSEALPNNRFGSTSSSNKVAELDFAMSAACIKAKSAGIEVYATSFGSGISNSTRARLKACATNEDYYRHSADSAELAAFFNHIGQNLSGR